MLFTIVQNCRDEFIFNLRQILVVNKLTGFAVGNQTDKYRVVCKLWAYRVLLDKKQMEL